jgi:histidyl-tRNA synthetase
LGAYALIVRLEQSASGLAPGTYLYAGSAYGPGGIPARVRRHLKPDKKVHWHVDRLTNAGTVVSVVAVPGGRECAIVAAALRVPGMSIPSPGFGSSDCTLCPAHLLRLPDGLAVETLVGHLQRHCPVAGMVPPSV